MARRFIAGARCPGCGNVDTLYVDPAESPDLLRCTRCPYRDDRASPTRADAVPEDDETRVIRLPDDP